MYIRKREHYVMCFYVKIALYDEDEKTLKEEYAGKETTLEESYNKKKAGLDEKEAALKKEEKTLKREYAGKESALIEREEALKQECANQVSKKGIPYSWKLWQGIKFLAKVSGYMICDLNRFTDPLQWNLR